MLQVLIVCDTNTSLSPLAAGILKDLVRKKGYQNQIEVSSAGCYPGQASRPIERRIAEIANERGIQLEGASRPVKATDLEFCDFVLCMNENNYWYVNELAVRRKGLEIRLLTKFSKQMATREIPDPLQGELAFSEAYSLLQESLFNFVEFVETQVRKFRRDE